jgi:hypothetical protein
VCMCVRGSGRGGPFSWDGGVRVDCKMSLV